MSTAAPTRVQPEGTPQQEAFWTALVSSGKHIVLSARAGSGKSFSCREGMIRLDEQRPRKLIYLAFNKAIADSFAKGLTGVSNATACTMHALGWRALRQALPHLESPDNKKLSDHVKEAWQKLGHKAYVPQLERSLIMGLVSACKSSLLRSPDRTVLERMALVLGLALPRRQTNLADAFAAVSICLDSTTSDLARVDFDDMIWLPVIKNYELEEADTVFVDEAQDLNPAQHAFTRKLIGDTGRLVVVGDPHQAIYAFRGADSSSIATLTKQLEETPRGCLSLDLTFTRRCPSSHVSLARRLVPDFEAMPGSKAGRWDAGVPLIQVAQPGTLVLARTNAPLLSAALGLARENIPVAIRGKDLGNILADFVLDLAEAGETIEQVFAALEEWRTRELKSIVARAGGDETELEQKALAALEDRVACVHAAASHCLTAGEVAGKLRSLFRDDASPESCVTFSSIHRAKGLEARTVAILEPDKIPHPRCGLGVGLEQERNLLYVAITRSLHYLAFVGPLPKWLSGAALPAEKSDELEGLGQPEHMLIDSASTAEEEPEPVQVPPPAAPEQECPVTDQVQIHESSGPISSIASRTPIHVKTISVKYGRKINLGDYNSADLEVALWADLDTTEPDYSGAVVALQASARDLVRAQAASLLLQKGSSK